MAQSSNPPAGGSSQAKRGLTTAHELLTCTIKNPPFSYVHLSLVTSSATSNASLDELQVKSYCVSALRQFLGLTGAGISIDVLKASGSEAWIRVPREDLGSVAAAMTAWKGTTENGVEHLLVVKQCSDYLGAMVGSDGQDKVWNS